MELKDIAILIGLSITVGGIVWTLSRLVTQGATIKDLMDLERKIEARLQIDKKDSVESHASFVTRREFEAAVSALDKRFDKIDGAVERIEGQLDARISTLDKTITGLVAVLDEERRRQRG